VAVIGTIASHILTVRREVQSREHEDRRQRDPWERETQLAHRDDRVALYKTLLADVRTATDSWTAATTEGTAALVRLRQDVAEIELLGSTEVGSAANELLVSAFTISDLEQVSR
jgi:hypothetical protein